MKPNKAFKKFGDMAMNAPADASLTIGLSWVQPRGWRVMMQIHTAARAIADSILSLKD